MQPIYYTNQTERRTTRWRRKQWHSKLRSFNILFRSVERGAKTARVNARLSSRESLLGGSFWTASTPTLRSGDMQRNIWSPAIMYTSTIKKARQASSVAVWKELFVTWHTETKVFSPAFMGFAHYEWKFPIEGRKNGKSREQDAMEKQQTEALSHFGRFLLPSLRFAGIHLTQGLDT